MSTLPEKPEIIDLLEACLKQKSSSVNLSPAGMALLMDYLEVDFLHPPKSYKSLTLKVKLSQEEDCICGPNKRNSRRAGTA